MALLALAAVSFALSSLWVRSQNLPAQELRQIVGETGPTTLLNVPFETEVPAPYTSARHGIRTLRVNTFGDLVHIRALASVWDRQPGMRYVWQLRVLFPPELDVTFLDEWYVDEIFSNDADRPIPVEFEDVIQLQLPDAEYATEVCIVRIPPHLRVADLAADEKLAARWRGPLRRALVQIVR